MMSRLARARILRAARALVGVGLLAAVVLAPSCAPKRSPTCVTPDVISHTGELRDARVLLAEGVAGARLAIAASYTIEPWGRRMRGTPPVLAQCPPLAGGQVRATATAIIVGDRHFPDDALLLRIQGAAALTLDGRRYRGSLALRRAEGGGLDLINVLPVEDYLYGVLGGETYPAWPAAALEAQAIVARSYTLWRMAQRREGHFDLYATVMDQHYPGMAKEDPRLRAAVDRTAGVVLLYQFRLFRCYYHSTCGGHTECVQDVFPDPPLLPLSAVPCGYCKDSKHYSWQRVMPRRELADALVKAGRGVGELVAVSVSARTSSGRAREIAIEGAGGRRTVMPAADFRLAVGPAKLPSVFFDIRRIPDGFEFSGRGFGHGVGMCQWGARGMAEAGLGAAEILRRYYPGAQLIRLYPRREG